MDEEEDKAKYLLGLAIEGRIDHLPGSECWRWKGSFSKGKYPIFYATEHGVRRGVFIRQYLAGKRGGVLVAGCGNWWCVNPQHIVTGGTYE